MNLAEGLYFGAGCLAIASAALLSACFWLRSQDKADSSGATTESRIALLSSMNQSYKYSIERLLIENQDLRNENAMLAVQFSQKQLS